MPVFIAAGGCWLCGGTGQVTTGEMQRRITCGMCAGSGLAGRMPRTMAEMVGAIAGMEGVERVALSKAQVDAAVERYGSIIERCLLEIEAEDAVQAGQPVAPAR